MNLPGILHIYPIGSGIFYGFAIQYSILNQLNGTTSQINFNWLQGDIIPGRADVVSIGFYFIFKAPITGSITFYISVDDSTTMKVGKI